MKLFALDSPLMEGLRKLADVMIVNLLFCVCSIPVITIGASFAALTESVQILADDTDNGLIFIDFFKAFGKHFKKATLLELLLGAVLAGLGVYQKAIGMMDGALAKSYTITFYVLVIFLIFFVQFLFPTLTWKGGKLFVVIKEAVLLSIGRFPYTLLSILVLVIAGILSYMLFLQSGYGMLFLWIAAGFGLVAYFNQIIYGWAIGKKRNDELPIEDE